MKPLLPWQPLSNTEPCIKLRFFSVFLVSFLYRPWSTEVMGGGRLGIRSSVQILGL